MLPYLPPPDSNQPRKPNPEDQLDEDHDDQLDEDDDDQLDEGQDEDEDDLEDDYDEQDDDDGDLEDEVEGTGFEEADPAELVTVATFPLLNAAELARLHLAEEGIAGVLLDAETVNMDWMLGNALGYIKLQVQRRDAAAALEIINRLAPSPASRASDDANEDEVILCLACGLEIPEDQTRCSGCGWSFSDETA